MSDACAQKEPQKHLRLFDAMNGHFSVLNRLCRLADRINGENIPKNDESKVKTTPSLKEFLNNAPDQMGVMTDMLIKQIDTIEETIF